MSFKSDLYNFLKNNAGLTALVGDRIYPIAAAVNASFPYLTVRRIRSEHDHHMANASGLNKQGIEINCFDADPLTLEAVSEALRNLLDGYRGTIGSTTVRSIHLIDEEDDWIPPTDSGPAGAFVTSMEFRVTHLESVPTHN